MANVTTKVKVDLTELVLNPYSYKELVFKNGNKMATVSYNGRTDLWAVKLFENHKRVSYKIHSTEDIAAAKVRSFINK